jgi:hypothetical protein
MSHLRRVLALILLAVLGWLLAFGAVGTVTASATDDSTASPASSAGACC